MSDEEILEDIEASGHGSTESVICRATILHEGWEMDNVGWVVRMANGTIQTFTTSHGGLRTWPLSLALQDLQRAEDSAGSIRNALQFFEDQS